MGDLKRFVLGFVASLSVLILCSAALVVPRRRASGPETRRFFAPQTDPLFQAQLLDGQVTDARVTVLGTSRAETSFNPSLFHALTGQLAINLGTAGTSLAGGAATVAFLADRWTAAPSVQAPRRAVYLLMDDELEGVERRLGRYSCAGSECFQLWRGAPLAEVIKQQAAWAERSARLSVGWDLRALAQALLSRAGRPRATWSDTRCAALDERMTLDEAKHVPIHTYCPLGFSMLPPSTPPLPDPSRPLRPWKETAAEPMSGLNVLARQLSVLRAAGAAVTIVILDAADRALPPDALVQARRTLAGAQLCHYRPRPTDYADEQHLSVIGAARLTRWLAAGKAPAGDESMVECWQL